MKILSDRHGICNPVSLWPFIIVLILSVVFIVWINVAPNDPPEPIIVAVGQQPHG